MSRTERARCCEMLPKLLSSAPCQRRARGRLWPVGARAPPSSRPRPISLHAELGVDGGDMSLYGCGRHVQAFGDLLDREVRREEGEDPDLGRRKVEIGEGADPTGELRESPRQHARVRIPVQRGSRGLGVLLCARTIAEIEADVAPPDVHVGVEPSRAPDEVAGAPRVREVGRRSVEVSVMNKHHCSCGERYRLAASARGVPRPLPRSPPVPTSALPASSQSPPTRTLGNQGRQS